MTKKTRLTQGIATNEKFGLTGIVRAYLYRDIRVNVLMYAREICVKATFYVLLQQPRQVLLPVIKTILYQSLAGHVFYQLADRSGTEYICSCQLLWTVRRSSIEVTKLHLNYIFNKRAFDTLLLESMFQEL